MKFDIRMKTLLPFFRSVVLISALLVAAPSAKAQQAPKKILFYSKSSVYEHDMIKEKDGQPSKAAKILIGLGQSNNIEFTFTKDGTLFTPENIAKYDAFFFYTEGNPLDLGLDKQPPMTKEGKAAFLDAIHNGKGFIGVHSASDTFHSPGNEGWGGPARWKADGDNTDPYLKMLGAEFIVHGAQQKAHQICVDKNFPGMSAVPDYFGPLEEWYSLKDFAPDLHVLLVQDTSTMNKSGNNKAAYDRPNYPSTFVHMYGAGRVFYTTMGHRDDVWNNPVFQQVILGGMNWALGRVNADITPNLTTAAPDANVLPPAPTK